MAKSEKSKAPKKSNQTHRSPCPVACCLDVVGDRWTLLIIRDLYLGRSRFRDLVDAPEGIPTNILSNRLARLLDSNLVQQVPAADGTKRLGYKLTKKGRALGPILAAMRNWSLKWVKGAKVKLVKTVGSSWVAK